MRALTKVGGIFFDRLDEPVSRFAAEATSGDAVSAAPALGQFWDAGVLVEPQVAGAGFDLPTGKPKIIGHMRNCEYLPHLMRFAQRDPNATGQLVVAAVVHGGKALSGSPSAMSLTGLYGDGGNLYAYLSGNPRGRADPTGLSWDSFAAVDEIVAEHAASQAAFMNKIIGGAHGAAILAATIASVLPFPGVSLAGELALAIMNGQSIEGVLIGRAIGAIPGVSLRMFVANLAIQFELSETAVAKDDDFETWYAGAQQDAQQAVSGPTIADGRGPGPVFRQLAKAARLLGVKGPSRRALADGLSRVQKQLGRSLPRIGNNPRMPHCPPRWQDGKMSYRVEPPHHGKGWHIDWQDWSKGPRGTPNAGGTIFLD